MKAIEKEGDKILATLRDERMKALKMEQERDEFRLKSRKMEKKVELAEESLLKQEKDFKEKLHTLNNHWRTTSAEASKSVDKFSNEFLCLCGIFCNILAQFFCFVCGFVVFVFVFVFVSK